MWATGRPDEIRVWDFDVSGTKQACGAYLRSLYDGSHALYPVTSNRFLARIYPADNGVTAHEIGTQPDVFELPEDEAPEAPPQSAVPRISRLMALAIRMQDLVDTGEVADYADLARLAHVSRARITHIMNLLLLAPDIQEAILFLSPIDGCRAAVRERNSRPICAVLDWRKQRRAYFRQIHAYGSLLRLGDSMPGRYGAKQSTRPSSSVTKTRCAPSTARPQLVGGAGSFWTQASLPSSIRTAASTSGLMARSTLLAPSATPRQGLTVELVHIVSIFSGDQGYSCRPTLPEPRRSGPPSE